MRRSKIVSPMHFVWGTQDRLPVITEEIEEMVYRCLIDEATTLRCEILAIGGMPDHIHIAVMFPATISYSQFIKQLKGASSKLMKELLPPDTFFYWQDGYGAFGFTYNEREKVISYITHQKQHHESQKLWPSLEATGEDKPNT